MMPSDQEARAHQITLIGGAVLFMLFAWWLTGFEPWDWSGVIDHPYQEPIKP